MEAPNRTLNAALLGILYHPPGRDQRTHQRGPGTGRRRQRCCHNSSITGASAELSSQGEVQVRCFRKRKQGREPHSDLRGGGGRGRGRERCGRGRRGWGRRGRGRADLQGARVRQQGRGERGGVRDAHQEVRRKRRELTNKT